MYTNNDMKASIFFPETNVNYISISDKTPNEHLAPVRCRCKQKGLSRMKKAGSEKRVTKSMLAQDRGIQGTDGQLSKVQQGQ